MIDIDPIYLVAIIGAATLAGGLLLWYFSK
jgi:hypothetical protein